MAREPGSPEGLYAPFAMRIIDNPSENLKILRECLALKLEDEASTPGTTDAFSEGLYEKAQVIRDGGKLHAKGGMISAMISSIGHEYCLSYDDKAIFKWSVTI